MRLSAVAMCCLLWLGTVLVSRPGFASNSEPILFIPGIKGSKLADANGKSVWLEGLHVLGLSTPRLALPLAWLNDTQAQDSLRPNGVLEVVNVFSLYKNPIYWPWTDAVQKSGRAYHAFAYDWRRSNLETLEKLEVFVDELRKQHGYKQFVIVGHSMGGMLAMALLNKRPELFKAVVFAGTPFGGSIGFLPEQHAGARLGLNGRIITKQVLFTFPSIFSFLPERGTRLFDAEGKDVPGDYYSTETWTRLGLSVFADGPAKPDDVAHLAKALAQAKYFRAQLAPRGKPLTLPVLTVASDAVPTVVNAQRKGRDWDFKARPTEGGDGRFLWREAQAPAELKARVIKTKREHSELLSDPEVISEILKL